MKLNNLEKRPKADTSEVVRKKGPNNYVLPILNWFYVTENPFD